jgi:hypothetical protein
MNRDITFQQAATRANPSLTEEGYPLPLTTEERGFFEIDLLKTVFGDSARFSRVPGDGNCFWWAVLRAILKDPTESWDEGQRATDQMKFLKTLFGQIYHNTITAKEKNANEDKLPRPVDDLAFIPDLSKYTEQDVFAYVSAFLNRPVWLFSKHERASNGVTYETSMFLNCYDQRENNKNVIQRATEDMVKQFEKTIDTIDGIHAKYPNNEPLVFLFQGKDGIGHYEVVTGYKYEIENYEALLINKVMRGELIMTDGLTKEFRTYYPPPPPVRVKPSSISRDQYGLFANKFIKQGSWIVKFEEGMMARSNRERMNASFRTRDDTGMVWLYAEKDILEDGEIFVDNSFDFTQVPLR